MRRITIRDYEPPRVEYLPNDGPEGMVCLSDLVNTVGTQAVYIKRVDGTVIEYQRVED